MPKTYKILTPAEFNLTKSPRENGKSFTENSLIKAKYYSKKTGKICIADDSGLEISEGVVEDKSTSGDGKLGGDEWDERVRDWLVEKLKTSNEIELTEIK